MNICKSTSMMQISYTQIIIKIQVIVFKLTLKITKRAAHIETWETTCLIKWPALKSSI